VSSSRIKLKGGYHEWRRSQELKSIAEESQRWANKAKLDEISKKSTSTGIEYKPLYTPVDIKSLDYSRHPGFPGEYPYTRGIYPLMYRKHKCAIVKMVLSSINVVPSNCPVIF